MTDQTPEWKILKARPSWHIELQPGDGTRYEFLVTPLDKSATAVTPLNFSTVPPRHIADWFLERFAVRALDVLTAPHASYYAAVESNDWVQREFFKDAPRSPNPWTLVAMHVAACITKGLHEPKAAERLARP